jgi:hypothetical protein
MDSWVLVPCQRSRRDLLIRLLESLDHPRDHVVIVATVPEPLTADELDGYANHVISYPTPEQHISRWWNAGLDYIESVRASRRHWEVLAISSDYQGTPYSVAVLGTFLRCRDLVMVGPDHHSDQERIFTFDQQRNVMERVPGACWMLRGESGLRVDTDFRWWYSDDDLEMQARKAGGVGVVPGTGLVSGLDSYLSEEKAIWAAEDRAKFIDKWSRQPW